jgi:hypothetical protein
MKENTEFSLSVSHMKLSLAMSYLRNLCFLITPNWLALTKIKKFYSKSFNLLICLIVLNVKNGLDRSQKPDRKLANAKVTLSNISWQHSRLIVTQDSANFRERIMNL